EEKDCVGISACPDTGGIERFGTDRPVGDNLTDMSACQMKLCEMSRTCAIAARKQHVLGVHSRSEFRNQIGAGAFANVSHLKTSFLRGSGCRSANGCHLQGRSHFAQVQADLGGPFSDRLNGVLAAEDNPFKFFLVQFVECVVKLVEIEWR